LSTCFYRNTMSSTILISRNVRLTFALTAEEIHVTNTGELIIYAVQFGPNAEVPQLTVGYLESLCSQFYFGDYGHPHAIADILLLNGFLRANRYADFYSALQSNLEKNRATVISTELSL